MPKTTKKRTTMLASRRYAAFLRGVMPTNARMPELTAAFEAAGFGDVRTVLSSGNVVFTAPRASESAIEAKAEAAMKEHLGRAFLTIVRPIDALRRLLEADPWTELRVAPGAKRVVSFLRTAPRPLPKLPIERDGAAILALDGREAFTAYVRHPKAKGPVFMVLIAETFGDEVTTRTWDTVRKVAG
jgi:uncharacterized protein (DUF1697 family)